MEKRLSKYLKIGISTAVLSSFIAFSDTSSIETPFLSVNVEAATVTKYTTTAKLNLRKSNSTKAKVLLVIPKGKNVTYIKKSGSWYQVKYSGKTGWVSSKYIKVTKTTTTSAKTKNVTTYSTTANLHLRLKNSTKSKSLLTIPKGKAVTYIKKSGSWFQVKYGGKTGWVSSKYIKVTKTTTTSAKTKTVTTYSTTANLHLRLKNSTKSKSLLTIPKGKAVTYIKKSGSWFQVKYGGKTGWVSSKYIKKTTKKVSTTTVKTAAAPKPAAQTTKTTTAKPAASVATTAAPKLPAGSSITNTVVYNAGALNLRASNSASSTLLATIPNGTKLTTNYKTTNNWYRVSYNGKTGFVSGDYLYDQASKDRMNQLESNKKSYVFMDLRTQSSVTAAQINAYINNRVGSQASVLKNTGQYFVDAGKKYGVNALYLAAHAIHESDFGRSTISKDRLNLFGFGAYDLVPYLGAVKFATIQQNIDFIALRMKATYLGNSYLNKGAYLGYKVKSITGVRIDSLSKGMNFYYASGTTWGENIAKHMNGILSYAKENAKNLKPDTKVYSSPAYPNGADDFPALTLAYAKNNITLYTAKNTGKPANVSIKKGEYFGLIQKDNNYWLTVKYNGKTFYAKVAFNEFNKHFTVLNLGRIASNGAAVPVYQTASSSSKKVATVQHKQYIELVLDKNKKQIKQNNYYKVKVNNVEGWVSASYIKQDLNK